MLNNRMLYNLLESMRCSRQITSIFQKLSQTSLVAQKPHLSELAEQIRECQNRSQGMKIDEWCQMHVIAR